MKPFVPVRIVCCLEAWQETKTKDMPALRDAHAEQCPSAAGIS